MQLGWIHRGVGAGFEDNLWFKKQGSSLNPPLQNLYSTKSQTAIREPKYSTSVLYLGSLLEILIGACQFPLTFAMLIKRWK